MPMHFGYQAHRHYGLGWRQPRSGRQMQQDPRYALRWAELKKEAESNAEIERLVDRYQRVGYRPRQIVDAFERDADGTIAEIRRRKAALDRSRG